MQHILPNSMTFKHALLAASVFSASSFATDLPDFSALIKENAPTVVQIDSRTHTKVSSQQIPKGQIAPEDLLRYFFDGPGARPQLPQSRPSASHGSGFFIDETGYILTNAHVVNGSDEITVSTTDQTEYDAELIGLDERTDVALLKIKKQGLSAAKIGNSDEVEVGNWVLAIGSPFGFDYTATKGIVSAVSRSLPDGTYVPFIQTDAAVNPGNSGGPLFNLKGEVIGINSQIYSNTGSFNGLAFAIPINTAMNIAQQLKSKGFVSRGWLGVAIQNVDQDLAQSFGLKKPHGALVSAVIEDSPAEVAGIKTGDIILTFDGKKIKKSSALPPIVGTVEAGTKTQVTLLREGRRKTLEVTIGELDEGGNSQASFTTDKSHEHGLYVSKLSEKQKTALNVDSGVVIKHIASGSRAEASALRVGDVIININNQNIKNTKDFDAALTDLQSDKPVAVLIIRQGRSLFVPL